MHWILKGLCWIVDLCQILVKKLAGIDTEGMLFGDKIVSGSPDSSTVTGDIVEILIRSDVVRNLFISLLVLGIILLLIVTFVGVWKTEWDFGKDGNSKTKVINASLKALFNFIAVPVVAIFGIFVGNALLRAIDSATKGDSNRSMTNFVMSSAYSDACRYNYRYEGSNNAWINANLKVYYQTNSEGEFVLDPDGNKIVVGQGILNYFRDSNKDVHVDEILSAFQNNKKISKDVVSRGMYRIYNSDGTEATEYTEALTHGEFTFTFDDDDLVAMFFDNSKINYVLIYIVLFFMIKAMLTITFGLVKRLYYVVILFIISPPIVAMGPINDKALGEWRKLFISNLCSAFVTIGIYNIFLSIYPAFEKIKFPNVGNFVNFFVSLLMISVGLMVINEISGAISKLFGIGNVYTDSTDKGKSLWGGAFGMAGTGFKPFGVGAQVVGKGAQYITTAKYQGLGAASKQLTGDVTGSIKGMVGKTPISDMYKTTGIQAGLKTFKDDVANKKKLGVYATKKEIEQTRMSAERDFESYATKLGYLDNGFVYSRSEAYEKTKNSADSAQREKFIGLKNEIAELEKIAEKDRTDEQKTKLNNLKSSMAAFSEEDRNRYINEQGLIDSYENAKAVKGFSTRRLVRDKNGVAQTTKAGEAKAQMAKDAIAKQGAMNEVQSKMIRD
ncbi:MAG: hypothetical protein ACI4TI_04160, partial [Christensenellales bacterium]